MDAFQILQFLAFASKRPLCYAIGCLNRQSGFSALRMYVIWDRSITAFCMILLLNLVPVASNMVGDLFTSQGVRS